MKIALIISMILGTLGLYAKSSHINKLLELFPGSDVEQIPLSMDQQDFAYEMEVKNKKLVSIDIDLKTLPSFKNFLDKDEEGYCLIQKTNDHLPYTHKFFINKKKTTKYELTPKGKVRNVVILDFKDIDETLKCRLSALVNSKEEKTIRKMK